jgi:Zn-dependent M28 family amino/carboxypeptidase
VVVERLKALPQKNTDREAFLREAFQKAGCKNVTEQVVKHLKEPNVICVLPGETPQTIVVGAHLDKVSSGTGAIDDWSGAALLPSLIQGLAPDKHKHTYVFVAFAGEEEGLVGSEYYVKHMTPDELHNTVAMVNLECIGVSATEVWYTHSDRHLVDLLNKTAGALHLPLSAMNVDHVGSDDSESFKRRKIANITIHSITQQSFSYLHTAKDTIDKIDITEYYNTYRLNAAYLSLLDVFLDQADATVETPKR